MMSLARLVTAVLIFFSSVARCWHSKFASFSAALLLHCHMLGEFGIPCVCGVSTVSGWVPTYYTHYLSPHCCLLSHARWSDIRVIGHPCGSFGVTDKVVKGTFRRIIVWVDRVGLYAVRCNHAATRIGPSIKGKTTQPGQAYHTVYYFYTIILRLYDCCCQHHIYHYILSISRRVVTLLLCVLLLKLMG